VDWGADAFPPTKPQVGSHSNPSQIVHTISFFFFFFRTGPDNEEKNSQCKKK
jgi:hypothetical protein